MFKRIFFIINPAAGKPYPVLNTLNEALSESEIKWEVGVTNKENTDKLMEQAQAFGADLLAIYGGDGTIAEIAHKNLAGGKPLPLALIPGGTANILSLELGIPQEMPEAMKLITEEGATLRNVDMARINEHLFFTRSGFGFETKMVEGASQEMKSHLGNFAYAVAGVQALLQSEMIHFSMTLDGHQIKTDGISCVVANCGNVGRPGVTLSPVEVDDGFLDVFVFRQSKISSLFAAVKNIVSPNDMEIENTEALHHWRARHIVLETDPPAQAQFDGQVLPDTKVEIKLLEQKAQILAPVPEKK